MPTYQLKSYYRGAALFVALAVAFAGSHARAETVDVLFELSTPSMDVNEFDITADLDTLTSQLGTVSETGSTQLSGQINATLHVDVLSGQPVLTGIEFGASSLMQTPISIFYSLPLGVTQFSTSELSTSLESTTMPTGMIPIEHDMFQANSVRLLQNAGTASVTVPSRGPEMQNLASAPVPGVFDPMQQNVPFANIVLSPLTDENEFQVDLSLPLNGQMLAFPNVGLPVELRYGAGNLVATGSFQLSSSGIPEPSSLILGALAAGMAVACRTLRARTVG